ncbi:GNAT family N-acetyltransferase [Agrobacterium sp. a22-2]|uniref:GNAT family N-acetyltransferase n=1 Tax=Agrobacterium sp. a22-2 TaxID=2283840 RepID=UPI00144504A7|nr:GNAT family N-acetyltransferase [Agrobacterium sp. a22-2]
MTDDLASLIDVRTAQAADVDAIADVFTRSHGLLAFLPKLHSPEEDRDFIATQVIGRLSVLVACRGPRIVGFIAFGNGWIEHLYVDPEQTGRGIGTRLLAAAIGQEKTLHLWAFEKNLQARRFYEHHGFAEVRRTDGRDNEEKEPDILYALVTTPLQAD